MWETSSISSKVNDELLETSFCVAQMNDVARSMSRRTEFEMNENSAKPNREILSPKIEKDLKYDAIVNRYLQTDFNLSTNGYSSDIGVIIDMGEAKASCGYPNSELYGSAAC